MPESNNKDKEDSRKKESSKKEDQLRQKENVSWEESDDFGGIPKDVNFKRNMGCGG